MPCISFYGTGDSVTLVVSPHLPSTMPKEWGEDSDGKTEKVAAVGKKGRTKRK
jgi:hypothetical protein